jgi:hypothetical protein
LVGLHDAVDHFSTILLVDNPANPRYPNRWFARTETTPGASFALTFDEIYTLEPDDTLSLRYRLVFANGAWTRKQVESFLSR